MSVEVKWNCGENFILFITVIHSALFSVIVNDNNNNNQITIIIVIFLNIYIFFFGTEVCRKKLPYTSKEENEIRSSALKVAGHASYTISTGIMGSQRVREFFALGSAPGIPPREVGNHLPKHLTQGYELHASFCRKF